MLLPVLVKPLTTSGRKQHSDSSGDKADSAMEAAVIAETCRRHRVRIQTLHRNLPAGRPPQITPITPYADTMEDVRHNNARIMETCTKVQQQSIGGRSNLGIGHSLPRPQLENGPFHLA